MAWEYRLSTELYAHSSDVRVTAAGPEGCLLSGSRDRTARLWHPQGVKDFSNVQTYKGHDNFVSAICFLGPCNSFPEGLVVTGSNDKTICGYNVQESLPVITFKGHENTVCDLNPGRIPGTLLSASWDATGRTWSTEDPTKPLLILKGHAAVVWAIIELGNGTIATASADKCIFIWSETGEKLKSLSGHTDCVRGLTLASKETFLSCANDATIRLWTNNGECLNTFYGHSNYIYSVCMNPYVQDSQCFVSCGEDSTVRIWSAGDNVGTIALPAQSVWCVTCLYNGDIVAGASDGIIRVFTRDVTRQADRVALKSFEDSVIKHVEAATQEIGGYKVSDLPGPESLFEPGKRDGQTKLVRTAEKVKCYSWSNSSQSWNEVGDVMGSAQPTEGKTVYQGKEYDYVFSVDIEDGKPPLKLPYNKTEDPWVAAQTFIHKNFLPQSYLEQVANFIVQNSKAENSTVVNRSYADPFTGGTRYIPSSDNNMNKFNGKNADPFTGSSSYSTSSNTQTSTACSYFPQKSHLRFDQANYTAILNKLREFNENLYDEIYKVKDENLVVVMELANQKSNDPDGISTLKKLLKWPKEILFPVLDVLRLVIRGKYANIELFRSDYEEVLMKLLLDNLSPESSAANQLVSLRSLANSFSYPEGEQAVLKKYRNILDSIICLQNMNKNLQVAVSTLLLNMAISSSSIDSTFLCQCLLNAFLKLNETEAIFRGLISIGTMVALAPAVKILIVSDDAFMNKLRIFSQSTLSDDYSDQKVAKCATKLKQILQ